MKSTTTRETFSVAGTPDTAIASPLGPTESNPFIIVAVIAPALLVGVWMLARPRGPFGATTGGMGRAGSKYVGQK